MITRGTTPPFEFVIPLEESQVECMFLSFSQGFRGVVVEKSLSDMQFDGKKVYTQLTQEETLSLDDSCEVEIQIRLKTISGEALASDTVRTTVGRILKDGKI